MRSGLRGQQGGGDDSYSVLTAVGLGAGADHCGVEQIVAEPVRLPAQVPDVIVVDGGSELHFQRDHSAVTAFHDQVHFMLAAACAQM